MRRCVLCENWKCDHVITVTIPYSITSSESTIEKNMHSHMPHDSCHYRDVLASRLFWHNNNVAERVNSRSNRRVGAIGVRFAGMPEEPIRRACSSITILTTSISCVMLCAFYGCPANASFDRPTLRHVKTAHICTHGYTQSTCPCNYQKHCKNGKYVEVNTIIQFVHTVSFQR